MEKDNQKIYILNGLHLAQTCLIKQGITPLEVLPLNYNYQNIRIVATWTVDLEMGKAVVQTSGCDCGPQPSIKAGLLSEIIEWKDSNIKKALESGKINVLKREFCSELACQELVTEVFILRRPELSGDKGLFEKEIKRACGGKKVKLF